MLHFLGGEVAAKGELAFKHCDSESMEISKQKRELKSKFRT